MSRILGIEIGSSNIKLIEVSKKKTGLLVHQFSIRETPSGSVKEGIIQNQALLKKVIEEELREKKYKAKKVVSVVQGSSIIVRNISLEKQKDSKIKDILDTEIEKYLPIEKELYQIDYKVTQQEDRGMCGVMLVAAPRTMIIPLVELIKSVNLFPIAINITSEAVGGILAGANKLIDYVPNTIGVLDIGGNSLNMTIIVGGQVILNRYISFGVNQLNEILEKAHDAQQAVGKSLEKVDIEQIIRTEIERHIISELERILQFYYRSYKDRTLEELYLIGGGADIEGLQSYIRYSLNLPVTIISEIERVREDKNIDFKPNTALFISLLGAINSL